MSAHGAFSEHSLRKFFSAVYKNSGSRTEYLCDFFFIFSIPLGLCLFPCFLAEARIRLRVVKESRKRPLAFLFARNGAVRQNDRMAVEYNGLPALVKSVQVHRSCL